MASRRYRWWHGLAFFAGVQLASYGLSAAAKALARRREPDSGSDQDFYRAENLPVFAPPSAAFPIAWSINSAAAIAGALHVLNLDPETQGRSEFLQSQAVAWTLFATFNAAYFGLRSPINAAAVTALYTAATAASLDAALRKLPDQKAALALAPTAAWLTLANPVGLTQAAWNYDSFWKIGPLMEPNHRWLKKRE